MQSHVDQVQQGSGEGSGEGLGGSGEGSGEGLGGFGAEPGHVQQGSGEGSGEGVQSSGKRKIPATARCVCGEHLNRCKTSFGMFIYSSRRRQGRSMAVANEAPCS